MLFDVDGEKYTTVCVLLVCVTYKSIPQVGVQHLT